MLWGKEEVVEQIYFIVSKRANVKNIYSRGKLHQKQQLREDGKEKNERIIYLSSDYAISKSPNKCPRKVCLETG